MTRWTFRILLCLLLGVVTTVGVAWMFETNKAPDGHYVFDEGLVAGSQHQRFVRSRQWPTPPGSPDWYWTNRALGSRFVVLSSRGDRGTLIYAAWQTGWPMLALESRLDDVSAGETGVIRVLGRDRPLLPMPLGFLVNTCFYSVLWTVSLLGFSRLRTRRRRHRGCCPKCGYDLRGEFDSGCSECGWGRA